MLFSSKNRYAQIQTICYIHSSARCSGVLKGLCGSLEIAVDRVMDCEWQLEVPDNFCINITVDNFPNGDPFADGYFLLSVADQHNFDGNSVGSYVRK